MPSRKTGKKKKGVLTGAYRSTVPWIVIAFAALVVVLMFFFRSDREGTDSPIEARLLELAADRGVDRDSVVIDDPIVKKDNVFVRTWRFEFADRRARDGFVGDVEIEAAARHAGVTRPADLNANEVAVLMTFGPEAFDLRLSLAEPKVAAMPPTPAPTKKPTATPRPQPAPGSRGRLAILLDDGGQSYDLVPAAIALPPEVGIAVLPFLPKSAETATAMHGAGHEVWLHLPMEPQNYPADNPGPGAVLVGMTTDELRTTVHSAINNIPYAVGVNNHMGSKATADLKTMTWVMQELSARGMAFIDSRTTTRTVAEEAARAQGVPTNRRHVFLDNQRNAAAIRSQLDEAVYRCRIDGEAIAIGHLDPVTVQVLAEELPGIAERGADLVKPSDLVR
jgi:polysaccharide deacetylase 2 family uncharacterized protein YibQ